MAPASTFIGRSREQARLVDLVASAQLVTVAGPGGIGKTRLVAEASTRFDGDVVVVELSRLPPDADETTIAGEMGYVSVDAAAAALAERATVVVLDNCDHVLDAVAGFVTRLLPAGDDVRVVTTSREPLGVAGEQVLIVDPLDDGDAVQLFTDRAAAAGAAFDADDDAVVALCRALDGMPLALELAAARARAISPVDFLSNLERRLDLLQAPARRGTSTHSGSRRHASVRDAIDTSVELLAPEEREFFEQLGVFAGPFDADLAAAVTETDPVAVLDLLARLVERSLLAARADAVSSTYSMLDLLREYAVDALAHPDAVLSRFTDAMVAFADRVVVEGLREWSGEVIARITAQAVNLFAAIDWCVDHDDSPDRVFRLVLPLFAVVHRGRSPEVLAIGSQVLARWPEQRAPWRSEAIAVLAVAAVFAGDNDRAVVLAESALAEPDASSVTCVLAQRALGFATRARGDFASAIEHFARGRDAALELGTRPFARELAGLHASTLDLAGERDQALILVRDVIAESTDAHDHLNVAWAHLVAACILLRAERDSEARADIAHARAAVVRLGFPWWQGLIARIEAVLDSRQDWDAAIPVWHDALSQAVADGALGEVALILRAAAVVAARHGLDDIARELLAAAPPAGDLTVIGELFPDEVRRLVAARAAPAPPDLRSALERARTALGRADAPPPVASRTLELRREGDTWALTYGGTTARVRDTKGMADLAVLLGSPGRDVHCLELMGGGVVQGDAGPALDAKARRAYETRIVDLQHDIDDARDANDFVRAERAEAELDALTTQLAEAFGLGNRDRATGSSAERARTAVTYRIRASLKRINEVHPELARHLTNAVRTGTWCSYRPETDVVWTIVA